MGTIFSAFFLGHRRAKQCLPCPEVPLRVQPVLRHARQESRRDAVRRPKKEDGCGALWFRCAVHGCGFLLFFLHCMFASFYVAISFSKCAARSVLYSAHRNVPTRRWHERWLYALTRLLPPPRSLGERSSQATRYTARSTKLCASTTRTCQSISATFGFFSTRRCADRLHCRASHHLVLFVFRWSAIVGLLLTR
jgi:hypothetical protein